MDRNEAASVIQRLLTCADNTIGGCRGKCETCRYNTSQEEIKSALKLAVEALEAYVPDKNVGKWIPVTPETLPEEGRSVLITREPLKIQGYKEEVIKAKRSVDPRSGKVEWWSPEFGTLADKEVLAWEPLPKPWKGE